jgi:hypothetical protein
MTNAYVPCPCGSGKKFKFCCKQALSSKVTSIDPLMVSKWPVDSCYISSDWQEMGIGTALIIRGTRNYWTVASFLVDIWCLGVKDVFIKKNLTDDELRQYLSALHFTPIDYEDVRAVIFGAVDFARQIQIEPHSDWNKYKVFIEDQREYVLPEDVSFGHEGKHFYVQGPYDHELYNQKELMQNVNQHSFVKIL